MGILNSRNWDSLLTHDSNPKSKDKFSPTTSEISSLLSTMDNDGASSSSRQSGGAVRGDGSSSATQGFLATQVGNERNGVAPKCRCGVYVVLYLSKTPNNLNQLFFGCPFFKAKLRHCNFFLWLDRHASKFDNFAGAKVVEEDEDVNAHLLRLDMESRLANLEDRVASIERKKKEGMKAMLIVVCLAVVLISICVTRA
ncbi:hypothetical protein PIB30_034841 [Stylosanthes scabra]|uniref:GRF-type domain-containing protein n=1 Tax=Stylosanthes scabra TaxID=79078 RepID=A0ABU6XCL4_9FABA|nr:hypothetical protein [Stylosanthes scabra]